MTYNAPLFGYHTPDRVGNVGKDYLGEIGKVVVHQGNGKVYRIVGIEWDGSTDLWCVVTQEHTPRIYRPIDNHQGYLEDGRKRFIYSQNGDAVRVVNEG